VASILSIKYNHVLGNEIANVGDVAIKYRGESIMNPMNTPSAGSESPKHSVHKDRR
jgi:hypothetical protein